MESSPSITTGENSTWPTTWPRALPRVKDAPQEIRVWIADHVPVAWSFDYLHVVPSPSGFPPKTQDLSLLADLAERIGSVFTSRLMAASEKVSDCMRSHLIKA